MITAIVGKIILARKSRVIELGVSGLIDFCNSYCKTNTRAAQVTLDTMDWRHGAKWRRHSTGALLAYDGAGSRRPAEC